MFASRSISSKFLAPSTSSRGNRKPLVVLAMSSSDSNKKKVLFVCLGNICRSPTAEAVFRKAVEDAGLKDQFEIDSCGTGGGSSNWYKPGGFSYHEGDPSDPRMLRTAAKRGIKLTSYSRPLRPRDLSKFDLIIGQDSKNIADILSASEFWLKNKTAADLPESMEKVRPKVKLMTEFIKDSSKFKGKYNSVPDPYYGGEDGFELVLDLLEDACSGLLDDIQARKV